MRNYQIIWGTILLSLLFYGCAKLGSPTGGPKDETPPRVVESTPENYSIDFDKDRIEIEFNEFIQLKNINQELVVSPPQDEKPVVRMRNKIMMIDLKNELLDSTTYTLNFGQAIADNNEANLLENYQFVFSTGSFIDSLGVSGQIVNAFDLKPSEDPVTIMLYDDLKDSIPYLDIPMYIGKSNKTGYFEVNNVKSDTFKVFALKDKNYNLKYDNGEEEIAFLDSTIILSAELIRSILDSMKISNDSLQVDSLVVTGVDSLGTSLNDSIIPDTITFPKRERYSVSFEIFIFLEDNKAQYMSGSGRKNQKRLEFYFNRPMLDTLHIEPLNFTSDSSWFIQENNLSGDSIYYWIKDSIIYKQDTLKMHLRYLVTDSIMNYIPYDDTVNFVFIREKEKTSRKQESVKKTESLKLITSIQNNGTQDLYKSVSVIPDYPVFITDSSKISLFRIEDTIVTPQVFTLQHDSINLRKYLIHNKWEEIMNYRLFIEPGAFIDMYGLSNDTLLINFKTQSLDHYGKLMLTLVNVDQNVIIQLLSDKDQVLRTKQQHEGTYAEFPWLEPGKYKIKIIFDRNNNGKWDTGRYLDGLQPEVVKFYSGEVNIRENWDLELTWDLKKEEVPSR